MPSRSFVMISEHKFIIKSSFYEYLIFWDVIMCMSTSVLRIKHFESGYDIKICRDLT